METVTYQIGWSAHTLWLAIRSLVAAGGTDLAASIAYYFLLSLLPFLALVVLVSTAFAELDTVRVHLSELLEIYFPASQEFLNSAITPLLDKRPVVGAISIIGLMWGANGLLLATNRTVNRAFGSQQRRILGMTVTQIGLAVGVMMLFLGSIAISGLLRVAVDAADEFSASNPVLGELTGQLIRVLFAVVPPFATFPVFVLVYKAVPNAPVPWRDAAFGALVAVILFEAAKYLFFWVSTSVVQQSLIYGPLSSVVILLIWSQMAAFIFLFGVSVAKESIHRRPLTQVTEAI